MIFAALLLFSRSRSRWRSGSTYQGADHRFADRH